MAKKETPATTQAEYDKAFEEVKSGKQKVPSFDDMGPLPKPKQYSPIQLSSKTPEPTFKSDVDNIVSGVKKVDRKINDTLDPVRKVMVKAAGKEEPGILSKYSRLTKFVPEGGTVKKMAKGGKVSQLAKANGCAVRGKTRGKIC
jgi:hypothetical protein